MFRRLRCQVVPKLGSTAGPRALGTKPGKSPNEAAMGSGRLKHRINIVPTRIPQSSLEAPRRALGDPEALDVAASSLPSPAKIGKRGWTKRSCNGLRKRVLGGLENRLPKGTTSNPEGTKMASGRPPGGFWAPGVPQMAAQAALRPHVGGSCGPLAGSRGRLGEPLAPLGAVLGCS